MPTHWGRRETIIFPSHKPIYGFGAAFLALGLTCLFLYLRFAFGQTPLQQFYTPIYLRTAVGGLLNQQHKYQLICVAWPGSARIASAADVTLGRTLDNSDRLFPLSPSDSLRNSGASLARGPLVQYRDKPLHQYLQRAVYDGLGLRQIYGQPLALGAIAFLLQLPFALPKDIERKRRLKYGRRLKGPVMRTR